MLGGIEASLRRLAHYDYWSNKLKRSVLLDSGADIISYGMGEKSIVAIAEALDSGLSVSDLCFIPGTVYKARGIEQCDNPVILPTFEEMEQDRLAYARSFGEQCRNLNPFLSHSLVEEYPHSVFVIQNPPSEPLTTEELDEVFALPYTRRYHPSYEVAGGVPAIEEVRFSIASNRGCMGDCAFCALNFHQGRVIQARSDESILAEAEAMTHDPEWKGYIHDVGGPTANFMAPACAKQTSRGACVDRRCLSPEPCRALRVTHKRYVRLLRKLRALPGVKKVFVRSGIRFDYALLDDDPTFIRELVEHHVSGQLRLAPEHVSDEVLRVMGKPPREVYERFCDVFERTTHACGKDQYIVPYLMSSHPGSTLKEAVELAEFCRDMGYNPEQVQDFYPTPSTVSTCIYYTGVDPRTMQEVYCPTSPHEKAMQRALIQYRDPKNHDLVVEALKAAGREDLIGYGPKCLVRPDSGTTRTDKRPGAAAKGGVDASGGRQGRNAKSGRQGQGAAGAHRKQDTAGKRQKQNAAGGRQGQSTSGGRQGQGAPGGHQKQKGQRSR